MDMFTLIVAILSLAIGVMLYVKPCLNIWRSIRREQKGIRAGNSNRPSDNAFWTPLRQDLRQESLGTALAFLGLIYSLYLTSSPAFYWVGRSLSLYAILFVGWIIGNEWVAELIVRKLCLPKHPALAEQNKEQD